MGFSGSVRATPLDPAFFANEDFQVQFPGASVLHGDSLAFLEGSLQRTFREANTLIRSIQRRPALVRAIRDFGQLPPKARIQVLKDVFRLETRLSGYPAPALILDDTAKRSTFFDFDPAKPDTGKVILNLAKLFADPNPYAALLFLIHETRHSYQFQVGFSVGHPVSPSDHLAYQKGFQAQREIFDTARKVSFCDFLTLNQEYEAFLFGNIVMEILTRGAVDTSGMGTLASQYLPRSGLRLHLPKLAISLGAGQDLLDAFNQAEKSQYAEMKKN